MENERFKELLEQRRVAVVHFSHHADMGSGVSFPNDLSHTILNYVAEARSCCAIYPQHKMNLPGSIGVLFAVEYPHVLTVCRTDSGSSDFGGKEGSMGECPTEETILESLCVPDGEYNEWRVRGAKPIGIFVTNTHGILAKKESTFAFGGEQTTVIASASISIHAIQAAFPSLPIFTMEASGLKVVCKPISV